MASSPRRAVRFEFLGEPMTALGSGRAGDIVARSLSRRLGTPVTLGLGAGRHELEATHLGQDDATCRAVVTLLSEEAW